MENALARLVAAAAHDGQRRLDGEPYFRHCERVARAVEGSGPRAVAVGYLHDVVEDTKVSPGVVRVLFGDDVAADVADLTRGRGEAYPDYVRRLCAEGSDVALLVKMADLADNAPGAPGGLPARYAAARAQVRAEIARRAEGGAARTPPSAVFG